MVALSGPLLWCAGKQKVNNLEHEKAAIRDLALPTRLMPAGNSEAACELPFGPDPVCDSECRTETCADLSNYHCCLVKNVCPASVVRSRPQLLVYLIRTFQYRSTGGQCAQQLKHFCSQGLVVVWSITYCLLVMLEECLVTTALLLFTQIACQASACT